VLLAKLLQLNKAVVVKFGLPNEIQIDYEIGNIVKDIPNMIKYYCKFTCNLVSQDYRLKPFICNGTGLQLGFIIMPYYAHGDLNSFKWTRASFYVLKNVLKQVVTSLLHAFDKHSFVHGDLHLMNILLRKTKKTSLVYGSHSVAIADSYYAIIMDYGKSQIIPNGTLELLRDLQVLFGCLPLLEASDIIINTVDMSRISRLLQQQKASTLDDAVYDEAWRMIDNMTILYAKSERPPVPNFQSMNKYMYLKL
jgi:serine/threonine protein kinase